MPKLTNTLSNSENEVSSTVNNPRYYTLSHFESANLFYIHTSECIKELDIIESEIETEFENSTKTSVKEPLLNEVYGYFSGSKDQYFRVRVISLLEKKEEDASCKVFYIDYGNTETVVVRCLFLLSDEIKQSAPQAICCKLNGFQFEVNEIEETQGLLCFFT